MDRNLLNYFLHSGPSRRFDVTEISAKVEAEGGRAGKLFELGALNKSILFKFMEFGSDRKSAESGDRCQPIRTLIFLPYNTARPGDGGESFVFSRQNLKKYCDYHFSRSLDSARFGSDQDRLEVIDSVPTLNPFLLKEAFDKADIHVPDGYLGLDPKSHAQLKQRLRARVRPLIMAAYEPGAGNVNSAIEELCELFMRPKEIGALRPFIQAMRLPPDRASDILSAWAGITFFEHEYSNIEPPLKLFAQWLSKYAFPKETLTGEEREFMKITCQKIRTRIREDWHRSIEIIKEYRRTYNQLIHEHKAADFITFMNQSREHYWALGDLLGRLEQTNYAWAYYTRNFPSQALPYDRLTEFYEVLKQAHLAPATADGIAA